VIHPFKGYVLGDGAFPRSDFEYGANREGTYTLFGTTYDGGEGGTNNGTVYEIELNSSGTEQSGYSILHSFTPSSGDLPMGGVILHDEKLFGTTTDGGIATCTCGVVYELTF